MKKYLRGVWSQETGVCRMLWWQRILPLIFVFSLFHPFTFAQGRLDSVQHVREIVVVSKPAMREVVPSQKLNGEMLEKLNTHSVADALRYFSGIQLKDYGGVGGIKTVNIRSMGTHHLGISYDGVALGNAQNGQIDLGQFSLDNRTKECHLPASLRLWERRIDLYTNEGARVSEVRRYGGADVREYSSAV